MINFEPIGPLTLETFTDRTGDGSHGDRIEPDKHTENTARIDRNRHNGSGRRVEGEELADQPVEADGPNQTRSAQLGRTR